MENFHVLKSVCLSDVNHKLSRVPSVFVPFVPTDMNEHTAMANKHCMLGKA